jgi:isoleucyl-tRNA synthetase
MGEPLDLKRTLNLPKTDFAMKAGLPEHEPQQLVEWQQARLYERILDARKGLPSFILHDGPPYPTGTIHLGTALNKILKDLIVKSKSMAGYYAPYVPGWDCHGLPIETQVEKELGGKDKVAPAEFRQLCREFAARFVDQHKKDFQRLGVLGRWDEPYLTMDFAYEATIAGAFLDFIEKGLVYRGRKPVYWCVHDATALAEAEVEHHDRTSTAVWATFKLVEGLPDEGQASLDLGADVRAVIWTTTPWTLPHNRALAFRSEAEYAVVETEQAKILLAADRIPALQLECGISEVRILERIEGRKFAGAQFQHPFLPIQVPGILAEYVTLDEGSGIVHIAPGHGPDDFLAGQEYGLETYAPLDDQGVYLEGLPEYKGQDIFAANPSIVKLLADRGALLAQHPYRHSYPHCWRCHNPVIFRATEQWFIKMDAGTTGHEKTLRAQALEEIQRVQWIPAWGAERIHEMIDRRPDWCVSRQRFWGVPIIVFYCDACGRRLEDFAALRNVLKWFEKEGADAWFRHTPDELLPAGTKCACGAEQWRKENDILDVWFDSGSSHLAVLQGSEWPADVYLEGPDQYRGWFQSSLLVATGIREAAPYRSVVTHGWTLDEQGRPMSKSLGNVILPSQICEKWGADLLRLWVASREYQADVKMSERVMEQLSQAYRKIRNTFRFALGNLFDFSPACDAVPADEMEELDRWMLDRTADLAKKCRDWYAGYEFHRVYHAIHDFCVVDLSAFYLDVLKDRLYTRAAKNRTRRSAQTAVWKIAGALARLLAPILVFTTEEIWTHLPTPVDAPGVSVPGEGFASVHLELFPEQRELHSNLDEQAKKDWAQLDSLRREVLEALESARQEKSISSSLEARVQLSAQGEPLQVLLRARKELADLFIVSQVEISDAETAGNGPVRITVLRADGKKCERCWHYSEHVGENIRYKTVCERCSAALAELEETELPSR